jgi:hypothetical protein
MKKIKFGRIRTVLQEISLKKKIKKKKSELEVHPLQNLLEAAMQNDNQTPLFYSPFGPFYILLLVNTPTAVKPAPVETPQTND